MILTSFVLDGNQRVSIARKCSLEAIEAYAVEISPLYGLSLEANKDELLIKSKQTSFLENIGQAKPLAVRKIVFTRDSPNNFRAYTYRHKRRNVT